jgi:hypothetical protein
MPAPYRVLASFFVLWLTLLPPQKKLFEYILPSGVLSITKARHMEAIPYNPRKSAGR